MAGHVASVITCLLPLSACCQRSCQDVTADVKQCDKLSLLTTVLLQAIWFSASGDLALDAKRDFHDIGALRYEPVVLHDLKHCKAKPGDKLADTAGYDTGILFSTYDLLIAGKTKAPKPKPGSCHVNADHEDAAECGLGDLCEPADIDPAHREFGELQPAHSFDSTPVSMPICKQ